MRLSRWGLPLLAVFFLPAPRARAGLYYSGEEIAPLPSQWRGFLLDQRLLRTLGFKPAPGGPSNPLRQRYEKAVVELAKAHSRRLSADELADVGALYVRLGNVSRAIEVLRAAQRDHPHHFKITSNLGTAWQMQGDLVQAEACLREAVRLAPGRLQPAEELQHKLVQLRQREPRGSQELDDLLGVRFVNDKGEYEPGRLGAVQRKRLRADAVASVQQVALWLPTDGRLLWLLGELAASQGDVRTAAAIMDGCVTEFGLRSAELRRHRRLMREAADKLAKAPPGTRQQHEGHAGSLKTRSARPLVDRLAGVALPPVRADGLNALPWNVLAMTTLDRQFRPTFPKYLRELEGKQVSLSGFMQPLGEGLDMGSFLLIEYPVGCWYCEAPDIVAMVLIEMPPGRTQRFGRDQVEVTGRLKLNRTDPEDFLYSLRDATVKSP
jgi:hypothetical protein